MKAAERPFFLATAVQWYKRPDVQQAIVDACRDREVAPRYGEGFGRRPDQLLYPGDVLSFALKRATSFHCSEERWRNVSEVRTGAPRQALDALRTGWDLVLDIDCPYWVFSRLTTKLFIEALRQHGVSSVSVKFSGNKGFHIGVPFEAFPKLIGERETRTLFPEAPRALARYLLDYIATTPELLSISKNTIVFAREHRFTFEELTAITGKQSSDFIAEYCRACGTRRERRTGAHVFLCTNPSCGAVRRQEQYADFLVCERCGGVMEPQRAQDDGRCPVCGGADFDPRFAVDALIEVDTVLLASRHLFRTPYSLHEKSGLVSVVIDPDEVMAFEKERAKPSRVTRFHPFLARDRCTPGEATELLVKALSHASQDAPRVRKDFAVPEEAIPEELFPPCMRRILAGLPDGRKRAMFALTNFLKTVGWGHDQIVARLEEWNAANPEPLREVTLKSHLRAVKHKPAIPPPNCRQFYQDIGVCAPDAFCARVRNPAQYARLQAAARQPRTKKRVKLTEEQKAARRAYRRRKADGASRAAQKKE